MKRLLMIGCVVGIAACAEQRSAAPELSKPAEQPAVLPAREPVKRSTLIAADDPLYTAAQAVVDWWPGNGNGMDLVGTRQARLEGGATFAEGRNGAMAFTFDGAGAYVDLGAANPSLPGAAFTFMFWARSDKANETNGWQYLMHCWDNGGLDIALNYDRVGAFCVGLGTGQGNDAELEKLYTNVYAYPESDEAWHHMVVTFNGAKICMYRDGVRRAEKEWGTYTPGKVRMVLGRCVDMPTESRPFKGQMQDVAMFSRALTEEEVRAIYAAQSKTGVTPEQKLTMPQRQKLGAAIGRRSSPLAWKTNLRTGLKV